MRVGYEIGADIIVTKCPWLLSGEAGISNTNLLSPDNAIALIGIFLRSRRRFELVGSQYTLKSSARAFQWSLARALLPSGWRWLSAAYSDTRNGGSPIAGALAGSCITRLARSLRVRDEIHRLRSLPQTGTSEDEILANIDWLLISTVAEFDVTARVADIACGLNTQKHLIGWQKNKWIGAVRKTAPHLAQLFTLHTPASDIFEVSRLLRNTVHSQALQGVRFQHASGSPETRVLLESDDTQRVLDALDRLGGSNHWGVEASRGGASMQPDIFADNLIPLVADSLDEIMANTPVERFAGYSTKLLSSPPENHSLGSGRRRRSSNCFTESRELLLCRPPPEPAGWALWALRLQCAESRKIDVISERSEAVQPSSAVMRFAFAITTCGSLVGTPRCTAISLPRILSAIASSCAIEVPRPLPTL